MKKMLTNNLTLKLLSVVAAIMLWLVVMNIDDPYTYRDFSPVQVTMLNENVVTDQGKVYKIEDGSDVISLRVWGKKSILRDLNIEDFTATADMQKSIKYNDLVGIEVSCSNKNIRTADINMSRENVVISVEDAASEQFNVVVKQNGKVADGYMIGAALPEQSLIQINGPASVIAKIKRVEVEIKTTGVNSDRTIHGKLNVLNSDGEAVDTTYLEYTGKTDGMDVTITMLRTKTVSLTIGHTGTPADGYNLGTISYKPETVKIAGSSEKISQVTAIAIPDEALNIDGLTESTQQTLDITQYLPDGIRLADEADATVAVSVEIEKNQEKTLEIPVGRIGVQNVPKGYEVDFGDTETVEISVSAPGAELESLKADDVALSLNLEEYSKAGSYTAALSVTFPDSTYSLVQETEVAFELVKAGSTSSEKDKNAGSSDSTDSSGSTTGSSGNSGSSTAGNSNSSTGTGTTGTGSGSNTTGNNTAESSDSSNTAGDTVGENKKSDTKTE